jgi:hypothetical protein
MSSFKPVFVTVSGEELLSRLERGRGSHYYSIVECFEVTVLVCLGEGFVYVSRVTCCRIVGINSQRFAIRRVRELDGVVEIGGEFMS